MAEKPKSEKAGGEGMIKSLLYSLWSLGQTEAPAPGATPAGVPADAQATDEAKKTAGEAAAAEAFEAEAAGHALYELYCRHKGFPFSAEEGERFGLSLFFEAGTLLDKEKSSWPDFLAPMARELLRKTGPGAEEPADGTGVVKVTADHMSAWLFVFPPAMGGEPLSAEAARQLLLEAGVKQGLDEEKLQLACEQQQAFVFARVATGTPPVDGKDGEVVDHYRRDSEIRLKVKDDNTIDYKDLGWLQTIHQEEAICDIIPPTEAAPGVDVYGNEVRGKNGREAPAPKGTGTRLREGDGALVSELDGVVSFLGGRFRVDPLLIIKGDVETATGNLEVVGDLLVYGDILEGFQVSATGNITVQGMIEGARVKAGGNIQVGRGMNGNSRGTLEAKRDVLSKFIENGNVAAGSRVVCDTIINSTITCDGVIEVKTGRGAIIGGNITALERIEAQTIGNQSNRSMSVTLGSTANVLAERKELEEKYRQVAKAVRSIQKDIGYLQRGPQATEDRVLKMIEGLRLKLTVQNMQKANLERRLKAMEEQHNAPAACQLQAEVIYPPVQLIMGGYTKVLRDMVFHARVYFKEGEICVGSL